MIFEKALPVWQSGKENEMNICTDFAFTSEKLNKALLRVTGSSAYQVFVNGRLCCYGPARMAEGYIAVDEIELPERDDRAEILVRVIGYNCRSFNQINNVSFAQIEISQGNRIVAATGCYGFVCYSVPEYVQKVVRYSSQRQFSECWNFLRERKECSVSFVDTDLKYLKRPTEDAVFSERQAQICGTDRYKTVSELSMPIFEYLLNEPKRFDCFHYDETDEKPLEEYLKTRIDANGSNRLERWKFSNIETGFFKITGTASEDSVIIISFAEQLGSDGRPNIEALDACNVIKFYVKRGDFVLYSISPYTAMHMEVLYVDGNARVNSVSIKELAYPENGIIPYEINDGELNTIYNAAVRTFRHNTLDIYMDCPSRERAGWLFDSFFTSRTEYELTGKCDVERAFLRNFLYGGIRGRIGNITEMCYPSDVYTQTFVPQWSMWYIQELYEYFTLRGQMGELPLYEKQIMKIAGYFRQYENEYGLLERLDGWNFVEWSKLNKRVYDVSWPTNMLYADTLYKIGMIYGKDDFIKKANMLKKTIKDMAFDGRMFYDRAVRDAEGKLKNTDEYSETTQYYAKYFDVVSEKEYRFIDEIILGYRDIENIDGYPDIEPSDAIPGLYMRLELLLNMCEYKKALDFIRHYFGDMAHQTGTLWERKDGVTSRDHGFASYVAVAIKRAYEGLAQSKNQSNKIIACAV